LGLFTEFKPKFVKRFANLGEEAKSAITSYAQEVRDRSFPDQSHSFADEAPK